MLDDASWAVRREVVTALAAEGSAAVLPLAKILREERENEGRIAAAVDALAASTADVLDAMQDLSLSDPREHRPALVRVPLPRGLPGRP